MTEGGGDPVAATGGRTRLRTRTKLLLAALALLVAAPIGYFKLWPRDSATLVDADDAVDDFRANTAPSTSTVTAATVPSTTPETTAPPAPPVTVPAEGVYRYATTGEESVDILGGATHTYPAETTLTVVHTGCGAVLTWTPLEERSDEWGICATPEGIVWRGDGVAVWHHQFFSQDERTPTVCPDDVLMLPAAYVDDPMAGAWAPVEVLCTTDGRDWPARFEVLGAEDRTIEGVTVEAFHVRLTITWDGGDFFEHSVIDYWLDRSGLPLSMVSSKETRNDSGVIGAVTYLETFRADLVSLTPLT